MTTTRRSKRSPAFAASIEQLRALAHLAERGESQTEHGNAIRFQLEDLWERLSPEEQDLVEALSADLRTLVEQPPSGPQPTEKGLVELQQAISTQSWVEILALLRECPRLSEGVDGAQLRAQCWRALGEDRIAAEFYAQASNLLMRTPVLGGVISARRLELKMRSGVRKREVRPFLMEHAA